MHLPASHKRNYPAYTLIEMLIVLTIFIILSAFGFAAFSGLRDTVTLNQDLLSLEQDIRWAQRSALFLERNPDERWIYGIGIDFSDFEADGVYRLFKWCSQFEDYGNILTRSSFPNSNPAFDLSNLNGNLSLPGYLQASCASGSSLSEIVRVQGRIDGTVAPDFQIEIPAETNADGDVGGIPQYVLFEAVSGRAFFYDENGLIVNFEGDGELVSEPADFRLEVTAPTTGRMKTIIITNISGKISLESEAI
jgi:type II secretory pathway pseudopilin PulG